MLRTAFLSALIALAGCTPLQEEKYTFAGGDFSEVTFETDAPNWIVNVGISTSEVDLADPSVCRDDRSRCLRDLRTGYHQIQNRGFQQVQSLCWAKGRLLFPNCYRYCRKFPNRGADTVQVTGLTKQSTGLRKKPRRPVISDVSSLNIP